MVYYIERTKNLRDLNSKKRRTVTGLALLYLSKVVVRYMRSYGSKGRVKDEVHPRFVVLPLAK